MKKCPYCGENIQDNAKKCKFCKEWLDKKQTEAKENFFVRFMCPVIAVALLLLVGIVSFAYAFTCFADCECEKEQMIAFYKQKLNHKYFYNQEEISRFEKLLQEYEHKECK